MTVLVCCTFCCDHYFQKIKTIFTQMDFQLNKAESTVRGHEMHTLWIFRFDRHFHSSKFIEHASKWIDLFSVVAKNVSRISAPQYDPKWHCFSLIFLGLTLDLFFKTIYSAASYLVLYLFKIKWTKLSNCLVRPDRPSWLTKRTSISAIRVMGSKVGSWSGCRVAKPPNRRNLLKYL